MNIIRTTCFTAIALFASATATADTTPSVQAPSPVIDTQWALAALEDNQPELPVVAQAQPFTQTQQGEHWTFRELIDGQIIEIEITEIANTLAKEIAKHTVRSAMDLAGI